MEKWRSQVQQLSWSQYIYCMILLFLYDPDEGVLKGLYDRWYGRLCDRIYQYVIEHAQRGDPESIIKTMDRFCREEQWTFCLGDDKAPIVRKIVQETKPMTCLELGTFVGYSAINAARELLEGSRYLCVEADEDRAFIARKMVEFAGLQDVVQVIKGFSNKVIPNLKDEFNIDSFDYVFIDHVKSLYKADLILLEDHRLVRNGTVVVADNMVIPGSPNYLEYVRNSPKYESEYFESSFEFTSLPDGIEKSIFVG
ncbi:catechol O-methyltransferase-like [Lytechinus pictus]|uniref:catechol O-methyltransferase-like n=1 Tax=Lytechinus pictus TaxID=7653 RepID=UPI0030B9C661